MVKFVKYLVEELKINVNQSSFSFNNHFDTTIPVTSTITGMSRMGGEDDELR